VIIGSSAKKPSYATGVGQLTDVALSFPCLNNTSNDETLPKCYKMLTRKRVTVRRATVSLEEHPFSARCQLPNKVQVVSVQAMKVGYIGGRRYNSTIFQPQY
jgi:hypothetical protein